jgi:ubiquinone/menaquinone biosynthesis C-methylase UbiE
MGELKSNIEWKLWGKDDPLWGVASWADKQKGGATPWTEEEFYALGVSDWSDFLGHWRHYGIDTRSCAEIGCGAGRMTRQLAESFARVYAFDVSEGMIERARQAVGANVEFAVIDGQHLPLADGSVQAVFSTHVLQHLDSVEIGLGYFREFHRVLAAGGTLMVHLPLYELPAGPERRVMKCAHRLARRISDWRANARRRRGIKTMRGTPYPIGELTAFMRSLGFSRVEFRIFAVASNGDMHPFVFATR